MAVGEQTATERELDVAWQVADVQDLPFPDASFDVVLSAVGAMFAPDHATTARELLRVCRPGGTIAMANWTPGGEVGRYFAILDRYAPAPPGPAPTAWGDPEYVTRLLAPAAVTTAPSRVPLAFIGTPAELVAYYRVHFPPADDDRRPRRRQAAALEAELVDLFARRLRPRIPDGAGGAAYGDRCTTGSFDRSAGLSLPAAPSTSFCVFCMRASSSPDSA